jgi:hypothetical protein
MNAQFFRALAERALKTFAQTLAATLVAGGTDLFSVGWKQALSLAGMASLLSVLTSVGSSTIGDPTSPSLVGEGETPDAVTAVRTHRSGT